MNFVFTLIIVAATFGSGIYVGLSSAIKYEVAHKNIQWAETVCATHDGPAWVSAYRPSAGCKDGTQINKGGT